MDAECRTQPACPRLPLALRQAQQLVLPQAGLAELTTSLTTPVRSGMILTRHRLALGAALVGVGHRIGERRFTMHSMLGQDPTATLRWLATEANRWQQLHAARGDRAHCDEASQWWAARAARTAKILRELMAEVSADEAADTQVIAKTDPAAAALAERNTTP